ncbi:ABC transporter substrate-binding protein [Microbacterium pseudoresistens]|uniref:Ribose transport system substrate-binding protein n=1 Tax=Microbacterium pseudoresistens TaxID=640634 RepID=A0A7Y9ESU8_9MICO|nr:substrate-binding domain-containing protein [Microbacterium pseudoresistens]NYD53309.1 ribose transport system substrate-binding protein [Microbacterium pseudoresistens]
MNSTASTTSRSRRTLTAAAATVLLLGPLAACSSTAPESGGAGDDPVAGATIAIAGPQSGDPYYVQVACGAQAAGAKLGMDVGELQAPQNQNQAQLTTIVQNMLTNAPDALIYTPADPVAGGIPVQSARADGVTVIDVDAQLDDEELYDSFIASNHYEGAKEITAYLAELIGGEGQIAAIGSLATNPITQARIKGFEDALEEYPDIEVVSISYPEISADVIQANAASTLVKYPDLKAIYTTNYLNSTGAAVALRNANVVGAVKMVSWDAGAANIELLEEGVLQATVAQQPFAMGELAIEQIANQLRGDEVSKTVDAPVEILTSEDVDTPKGESLRYKTECS